VATQVKMPQLSLTMTEGTIGKWLKREGETVRKGEPLYEVETDKVINEVDAPASGVLRRIIVPEGGSAPIQGLIAIIADPDEQIPADVGADGEKKADGQASASVAEAATVASAPSAAPGERLFVSPRARKLAEERGVNLLLVKGSGPGGRIMEKDVERAIAEQTQRPAVVAAPSPAPAPVAPPPTSEPIPVVGEYQAVKMTGMRRTIAERMSRSQQATAHVTLTTEVDVGEAAKLREQVNAEWAKAQRGKLTYTDVIVKAVAKALRDHPRINSTFADGEIREQRAINVGVAVALEEGLIVPVIRNADQRSLLEISRAVRDLSERARKGALTAEEVSGGTFTVSNMGMMGVEVFTPIINWPECAILGVGRIAERATVRDGQVAVRPTMWLSLTFDHRIIDGAPAAAFLARVKELLESPYLLFV